MDKLKEIYKVIKNDFRKCVPPLIEKIDQEHHYEVWANYDGKETFFGKVIMHKNIVEIDFYPDIDHETQWTLYPGDIFKRTEDRFNLGITDLSPELQSNIEEVIENMVDYFRMEKLLPPQ